MRELKGKPLSLGAKLLAALLAIGGLVLKATISPELDIDAVLKVATFVALVFVPVDTSLVMQNIFRGGRDGSIGNHSSNSGGGRPGDVVCGFDTVKYRQNPGPGQE